MRINKKLKNIILTHAAGSDKLNDEDIEDLKAELDAVIMGGILEESGVYKVTMEEFMEKNNWKLITPDWLARQHKNGKGCSWMHRCASGKHWHLAKKTDAGRVRCKECGQMLDEGPQMLMTLQKLKGVR